MTKRKLVVVQQTFWRLEREISDRAQDGWKCIERRHDRERDEWSATLVRNEPVEA